MLLPLVLAQSIPFWVQRGGTLPTPIQHIVIFIQENRTVNNLFNGYCVNGTSPCATTVTSATISTGATVSLTPFDLCYQGGSNCGGSTGDYDMNHSHGSFLADCRQGGLGLNSSYCTNTGFDLNPCSDGPCPVYGSLVYVPQSDPSLCCGHSSGGTGAQGVYWNMADHGTLAGMTFQYNQGPSLVSHLYAGASTARLTNGNFETLSENMSSGNAGCNWPSGSTSTINMSAAWPQSSAPASGQNGCVTNVPTIYDLLQGSSKSFAVYMTTNGATTDEALWVEMITGFSQWCGPVTSNKCSFPKGGAVFAQGGLGSFQQFANDVAGGTLRNVTWIIPPTACSDHPNLSTGCGPKNIRTAINTVGNSPFWNSTVMCIYWDDWGGFYDPEIPISPTWQPTDPYELGFRVPLVCYSPYSNTGTIDNTPRSLASVNAMIIYLMGLSGPINATSIERFTDNMVTGAGANTMFNFIQSPQAFSQI